MYTGREFRKTGKKTVFLSHLYIKMLILPRQARDKHKENSKKDAFLQDQGRDRAVLGPHGVRLGDDGTRNGPFLSQM